MAILKPRHKEDIRVVQPRVNIHEQDKEIILEAEMVGLTKEDISLELKGTNLIVKGKRKECEAPKGYTVAHRERCPLEYTRSFVLGEEVDKSKIDAKYEDGILRVVLHKSEKALPKKIDIKG